MSAALAGRTKVFISYSHKDANFLVALQKQLGPLQRRGLLDVWVDTEIKPGDSWREEIDAALASAKVAILLVSSDFLDSAFINEVELPALLKAAREEGVRILPIIVRHCVYDITELQPFQAFNSIQRPLSEERKSYREKTWANVVKEVKAKLDEPLPQPPSPKPPEPAEPAGPIWYVPPYTPFFTGRERELESLRKTFMARAGLVTQALTGLGGMGKTQTALAYAHRYRAEYQTVFWAQAENREVLFGDMTRFASILQLPARDISEQQVIVGAVTRWLEANTNWLLILDNVNDLALVREVLPRQGNGHVLLTTQTRALAGVAQDAHLNELLPEDAQLLLLRRANLLRQDAPLAEASTAQQEQARALAEELGSLPLALDQAGAYLGETGCGLAAYLELYRSQRTDLLRWRGDLASSHEAVATTWTLALKQLEQTTPAAIELLRLCAFLHPEAIPEDLFREGAEELPPALQEAARNGFRWNEVLAALRRFSLIERQGETQMLSVHRLVQAVLRDELPADEQRARAERVARLVNRAFPEVKYETWARCQVLLPHALACADHLEQWQLAFVEAARLLSQAGRYLYERCQYREALPLLKVGLAMRETLLGPDHLDVATSLNYLGEFFYRQAQYPATLPLFQRVLAIREQALGLHHPDTAYSLNNLGLLYQQQGLYSAALPLLQQALNIREQTLGPDHPDVAIGLDNLASLYNDQGQYAEALPLAARALAIREQVLGPDHPYVAGSLSNLASLYRHQGQNAEVLPLSQRALAIREQALGPDHPDVAGSLISLATLYQDQGQYAEAQPFCQRALAIDEHTYGPHHPEVATDLLCLARFYRAKGNYAEAVSLAQRALTIREQTFGPNHPDVAYSLITLARIHRVQGPAQYVRSRARYEQAVAIMEKALPDHPNTAIYMMDLAGLLRSMGKQHEAHPLEAKAKAIRDRQDKTS